MIRDIMDVIRRGEAFCQEEAEGLMLAVLTEVARRNGECGGNIAKIPGVG